MAKNQLGKKGAYLQHQLQMNTNCKKFVIFELMISTDFKRDLSNL